MSIPVSQEYESIWGFATTLVAIAGVAVIGRTVVGAKACEREAKRLYEVTKYRR